MAGLSAAPIVSQINPSGLHNSEQLREAVKAFWLKKEMESDTSPKSSARDVGPALLHEAESAIEEALNIPKEEVAKNKGADKTALYNEYIKKQEEDWQREQDKLQRELDEKSELRWQEAERAVAEAAKAAEKADMEKKHAEAAEKRAQDSKAEYKRALEEQTKLWDAKASEEARVEKLSLECERLKAEMQALEEFLKNGDDKKELSKEEIEKLKDDLKKRCEKIEQLSNAIMQHVEEIADLDAQLAELEAVVEQLSRKISADKECIRQTEKEIEAEEEKQNELQSKIPQHSENEESLNNEADDLEEKAKFWEFVASLKFKKRSSANSALEFAARFRAAAQRKRSQAQGERQQREQKQAALERSKNKVRDLNKDHGLTQTRLDRTRRSWTQREHEIGEKNTLRQQKEDERLMNKSELKNLQKAASDIKVKCDHAEGKLVDLEQELETRRQNFKAKKEEKDKASKQRALANGNVLRAEELVTQAGKDVGQRYQERNAAQKGFLEADRFCRAARLAKESKAVDRDVAADLVKQTARAKAEQKQQQQQQQQQRPQQQAARAAPALARAR